MDAALFSFGTRLALPVVAIGIGMLALPIPPTAITDGTCRTFSGIAQGNDPSSLVTFTLCRTGPHVEGVALWSGESGQSVTDVAGVLRGDRLSLTDVQSRLERPQSGWALCFDGAYTFELDPGSGQLHGSYRSAACQDHGWMALAPTPRGTSHRVLTFLQTAAHPEGEVVAMIR